MSPYSTPSRARLLQNDRPTLPSSQLYTSRRAAVGTPTKGGVSFVTFIHIVSLLGQFKFEWPEGLKAFFGWFSVFKLNVAVARPECTTSLASLRSSPASDRRPSGVSLSYRNSRIRLA